MKKMGFESSHLLIPLFFSTKYKSERREKMIKRDREYMDGDVAASTYRDKKARLKPITMVGSRRVWRTEV